MANRNTRYNALRWSKQARAAMRERDAAIKRGDATTPLNYIAAYAAARGGK